MAGRKNLLNRRHSMPFGAECCDDGGVRFRLWAPAARRVELCIADGNHSKALAMEGRDDGWFEIVATEAAAGTRYRFRIDGGQEVPDPASRFQPLDVHGPSEVIAAAAFDWHDGEWRGRPWEEAVIYELHVGSFSQQGTFDGVRRKLDYLVDLGITAIELMPLSDFPGKRNWGYDGVLPFAPDSIYGRPEDLKNLIQGAHDCGIMVFLDVVYNHFGPEGNYLNLYAPQFFTDRHRTPWGNAINFDGPKSGVVRDFFIQNALSWLNEYHFDGLRLDAAHAIIDDSPRHFLNELAEAVRTSIAPQHHIHLILENDSNQSRYLRRIQTSDRNCPATDFDAQWNDDFHHALHVLISGERDGYYTDYSDRPLHKLGRCLTEGFAYQGEKSFFRNGQPRGESTAGLPPNAFVSFLQNHDQIGNRAFGERIATLAQPAALRAGAAIFLLAPSTPLLFMGEEFGAKTPFLFFCDFEKDLAEAVAAGRRNEFARFTRFGDPAVRAGIPDPNAFSTFERSRLDWEEVEQRAHGEWLRFYRELLGLRRHHIVPRLSGGCAIKSDYEIHGNCCLITRWNFADHSTLTLVANPGPTSLIHFSRALPGASQVIYASGQFKFDNPEQATLPPWFVLYFLES
jgi:maltooligosyltrehalose trehalohydrolase